MSWTAGQLPLHRVFTEHEVRLVESLRALGAAGDSWCAGVRESLERGIFTLSCIVTALESYPPLRSASTLAGRKRSMETLFQELTQSSDYGLEWALPTKAVLARAFGIAKVNFWTALQYAVSASPDSEVDPCAIASVLRGIDEAVEEAVYTRLAEELYGSFLPSRVTSPELKRRALDHAIDLWEGRTRFASQEFCPTLRSAWAARMRVPRHFGTLCGVREIAELLFRECDPRFLEVFCTRDADAGMLQAFEEFIFDLPLESLERVRARMAEDGKSAVTAEEVARYLGLPALRPMLGGPKPLYSSFRRRRIKAQYRTSMQAPGPKRTAESYVLEALLWAEVGR